MFIITEDHCLIIALLVNSAYDKNSEVYFRNKQLIQFCLTVARIKNLCFDSNSILRSYHFQNMNLNTAITVMRAVMNLIYHGFSFEPALIQISTNFQGYYWEIQGFTNFVTTLQMESSPSRWRVFSETVNRINE